jgi:hypothetical protein
MAGREMTTFKALQKPFGGPPASRLQAVSLDGKVPKEFWNSLENRRLYVRWLGQRLGLTQIAERSGAEYVCRRTLGRPAWSDYSEPPLHASWWNGAIEFGLAAKGRISAHEARPAMTMEGCGTDTTTRTTLKEPP